MDLKDRDDGRIDIIGFGIRGVVDIDWKPSARNVDDRSLVKEL